MKHQDIFSALEQLRDQIQQLETTDPAVREKLEGLIESVELRLASENAEHHSGLMQELRDNVQAFEVEHPRITGVLNELMVALSNIGI